MYRRRGKRGGRAGKLDTARLLYIAVTMLKFTEREAWHKTPYQITKLFKYHKEYNPQQFKRQSQPSTEEQDDIDVALGGF